MKRIGNCSAIFDWDTIILDIANQIPAYIGPSHKQGDPIPGLSEVTDLWNLSGFTTIHDGGNVGWDMFLLGTNFDKSVADRFAEFVGVEKYTSAWISRIHVGHMAPWHWDVHDNEEELSKNKNIRRFHCHIGKPCHGHIFLIEKEVYYNQPQGETFEWPCRQSWHAGMNSGLVPKYLFNFW